LRYSKKATQSDDLQQFIFSLTKNQYTLWPPSYAISKEKVSNFFPKFFFKDY